MSETGYKRGDILIQSTPFAFIIIAGYRLEYFKSFYKTPFEFAQLGMGFQAILFVNPKPCQIKLRQGL